MAVSPETVRASRVGVGYLENVLKTIVEKPDSTIKDPSLNVKIKFARKVIDTALAAESQNFIANNAAERLRLVPGMTAERSEELAHVVLNEKFRLMAVNQRRS